MNKIVETLNANHLGILIAVSACLALILFEYSALPVALPSIQESLGVTQFDVQWILNIYFLSVASTIYIAGALGDYYGNRRVFMTGMAVYACASFVIGCSSSLEWIVAFRAIQGIGTSLMTPCAFAILTNSFPQDHLGKVVGISAGIGSCFLILGPLFGGAVTELISWRVIFFLPLPIAVLTFFLSYLFIPEGKLTRTEKLRILPILGIGFSAFTLLYSVMFYDEKSFWIACLGLGSLISMCVYGSFSKKSSDFRSVFSSTNFLYGCVSIFLLSIASSFPIFIAEFLQKSLNYTPVETGSYLLISMFSILLVAPASGILSDKKGEKLPIFLGCGMTLTSCVLFYIFLHTLANSVFILALGMYGAGLAFITTPLRATFIRHVAFQKRARANGIYNTARYLGNSFGVVVLSAVNIKMKKGYLHEIFRGYNLTSLSYELDIDSFHVVFRESGESITALRNINFQSGVFGLSVIILFVSLVLLIVLLLTIHAKSDYKKP